MHDLIQPARGWQRGGIAGLPGLRPGDAARVDAPGRGDRGQVRGDPLVQVPELGVQEAGGAQQGRGGIRVLRAEPHPGQRPGERGELVVAHLAPAQGGEDPRVAFPGDHRLDDRAGGLVPGQLRHHGRQLAQGVLQQLLQPLPVPRAVRGQVPDVPGVYPQRPDLRRRHERGPQHPHLGQPRDPPRVLLVFGRPGRFLAWEEFTSCTASPASSSTTNQMRQ